MLGNLRVSFGKTGSRARAFEREALSKLQAALSDLPPDWLVLQNRRTRSADGPPWVKFIVLHPGKGIALIDLFPASPEEAIEPLDEFLARTGFDAFSRGDPPIVAIALAAAEIEMVEGRLAEALAAAPPCGIFNTDWTEAVVELLLSTPGLLLKRAARPSDTVAPAERAVPAELARPAIEPPPLGRLGERSVAVDAPQPPADPPLEFAGARHLWIAPMVLTACFILAVIGLVYADWPEPLPAAIAEKIAPRAEEPSRAAAAPAIDPERVPASLAAPAPYAAIPPRPKAGRHATRGETPIWEEARGRNTIRERKPRTPDDLLAGLNDWLSRRF